MLSVCCTCSDTCKWCVLSMYLSMLRSCVFPTMSIREATYLSPGRGCRYFQVPIDMPVTKVVSIWCLSGLTFQLPWVLGWLANTGSSRITLDLLLAQASLETKIQRAHAKR